MRLLRDQPSVPWSLLPSAQKFLPEGEIVLLHSLLIPPCPDLPVFTQPPLSSCKDLVIIHTKQSEIRGL